MSRTKLSIPVPVTVLTQKKPEQTLCKNYNPRGIYKFDDAEAKAWALNFAIHTSKEIQIKDSTCIERWRSQKTESGECMIVTGATRNMNNDEIALFSKMIFESIIYFNKRCPQHKKYIRYREELKKAMEEQKQREEAAAMQPKPDIVIY